MVPLITTAGEPGRRVEWSTSKPPSLPESAIKVWEPTVRIELEGIGAWNGNVEVSTTTPEGLREMIVPEYVIAGELGAIAVPEMKNPVGFAVMVCPAIVKTGLEGIVEESGTLSSPSVVKDGPSEFSLPDMLTGVLPCVIATPPIEYTAPGVASAPASDRGIECAPMIIAEDPKATGVPLIEAGSAPWVIV